MADGLELVATKADVRKEMGSLIYDIRQHKREVLKWMFVFWLGQIFATLGLVIILSMK